MDPVILTIDVGTGSARAGLVDLAGNVRALHAVPHQTHYPHHSWVEQNPEDWWSGTCVATRAVMSVAAQEGLEVRAAISCGQTHAPILLDAEDQLLTQRASLWNDKRAAPQADALRMHEDYPSFHERTGNPAAPSWPGVKLAWYRMHAPQMLDKAAVVLMPKDFINFRLTGDKAGDRTEAGYSYLYNLTADQWDLDLCNVLDIPRSILPNLLDPSDQTGRVTRRAAKETGLPVGLPVVVGAGDYPAAVLGSGICRPGQVSDITGTSALLSVVTRSPLIHPDVMNAAAAGAGCLSFCILDAAGDAVRWGRRELEDDRIDLTTLTDRAAQIPPGSDGLLFMPYLTGERLGQGPGSRAAFLGATAGHGKPHMHRAISEGVAMGLKHAAMPQLDALGQPNAIVAAGGGAHSRLLLQIKANVFDVPFLPVSQVECGLLGGAALAFSSLGLLGTVEEAAEHLVSYDRPVEPDPEQTGLYTELFGIFCEVRDAMLDLNASINRFMR